MEKISNGIHTDISIKDYHANTSHVSATSIKHAKVSLKEFDWFRRGLMPKSDGLHFDFGNAFESALLDKEFFKKDVAIMQTEYWIAEAMAEKPDLKVPKNSKKYKDFESTFYNENRGKYIIPDTGLQSYEAIELMLESCYKDPTIRSLVEGTEYQLSLFWEDPETGLRLKTRPDICKRKRNVVVNLKTALDGSPKAFTKDLVKFDYPLQACVEIKGCIESGLMSQVDNYFWLVVEKTPPYNATIYEFDKADVDICNLELEWLLQKIKKGYDTGEWPGYTDAADNPHGILQANIPGYYKTI